LSHPSRVRGLKLLTYLCNYLKFYVAPFTGAWIETRQAVPCFVVRKTSHPSRVRGLKQLLPVPRSGSVIVAPFTGAWIETFLGVGKYNKDECRTLHGCVD